MAAHSSKDDEKISSNLWKGGIQMEIIIEFFRRDLKPNFGEYLFIQIRKTFVFFQNQVDFFYK